MKKTGLHRIAVGASCLAACLGLIAAGAPGAAAAAGGRSMASVSPDIKNGEDLQIVPPGTGFQRWDIIPFAGTMGDVWLCLTNASHYCAAYNVNLTPGTRVWAEGNGTGDTQAFWVPDPIGTVCDGQSSCGGSYYPFSVHSFDKTYNGDQVMVIIPKEPPPVATILLANNGDGNPVIARSSSGGNLWVTTTKEKNMRIVNVEKTDSYDSAQVLTAP